MLKEQLLKEIEGVREYLLRSIRPLEEKDSAFAPAPGVFTVAAQVAHVAGTVEWFREGAFGAGFTMDFAEHDRQARSYTSLAQAVAFFNRAIDDLKAAISVRTEQQLLEPFPENPIVSGPKWSMAFGVSDHTAHHRGSLAVYTRLLGKTPPMPYADM